jgi:hypothetical protein
MRKCSRLFGTFGVLSALVIVGCGGGTAPRGAAESAPAGSASAGAPKGTAPGVVEASPKAEADDAKKLYRSPRDALTRKDVSYMIAFEDCDAGKKASEACAAQSAGDPKKRSECMSKARAKLEMDGIRFGQDTAGEWYWITIVQKGVSYVATHKIKVEFGEETETTIAIVPKGRDLGSKPMRQIPSKVVFEMESDYRMTSTDPQHGKLVYDVKIGMPSQ